MIATTSYEQSERLVNAGMENADCYWAIIIFDSSAKHRIFYANPKFAEADLSIDRMSLRPAWSMSALWKEVSKVGKFAFENEDTPEQIVENLVKLYEEYSNK